MSEVDERAHLEDGHKLGDKAIVASGAHIYGNVGQRTTVYKGATVRGIVGKDCTIGVNANVDERSDVANKVWIAEFATIKHGAHCGDYTIIPAHAIITSDMEVCRRGDVVVIGMVGSEGNGRYVTIGRQPDNHARLIVGCWSNYQGGSVDQLETRLGTNAPWTNYVGTHNPGEDLFRAQYLGIILLARSLEQLWSTYPKAAA